VTELDFIAIAVLGSAAVLAAGTFAAIANYLFTHELADRNQPAPNIVALLKTYRAHTRGQTGRTAPLLWVHLAAVGVFIAGGVVYVIARFI
jgi:hypothetical protein